MFKSVDVFSKVLQTCALSFLLKNSALQSTRFFGVQAEAMHFRTFRDGYKIPVPGYGTWQATDAELENAVDSALEAGYRHIDTATVYDNEKVIGKVLNRWLTAGKLNRSDLFIVTKLPPSGMRAEHVEHFIKRSLKDLQLDYLDLYLIHVPFGFNYKGEDLHPHTADGNIDLDLTTDHISVWKKMEEMKQKNLTKSIGVSNFNMSQVQRILDNCKIPPSNLQIECNAYNQQKEMVEFCKKNDIVVTAYSPLGSPGLGKFLSQFGVNQTIPDILNNPVVVEIAKNHKKKSRPGAFKARRSKRASYHSKKHQSREAKTKHRHL